MKPEHKKYILANINKKSVQELAKELNLKERKIKNLLEKESIKNRETGSIRNKNIVTAPNFLRLVKIFALLFIIASVVYASSLQNQFIYDDRYLVVDNLFIRNVSDLPMLFKTGVYHFDYTTEGEGSFYRPVVSISYMIDYFLWGLEPFGYHLTNIILHAITALFVYLLIHSIFKNIMLSITTSVLFLVHPIHTEAVAYISGRADMLAATFILIYLISFIFDINKRENAFPLSKEYVFANISLFLALLSKEISLIALPLLLFIFYMDSWAKPKRNNARLLYPYIIGFVILSFLYYTFRNIALAGGHHATSDLTLKERLLTSITAIPSYFRLLIFPSGLHMERSIEIIKTVFHTRVIYSFFLISTAVWLFLKYGRRSKYLTFSALWFIISIFPFLNIAIPLNAEIAEHWLYIPSIGIFFLVAYTFFIVLKRYTKRWIKIALFSLLCTIVIACGITTAKQNAYWRDDITFCERTLRYNPDAARCLNNLSEVYLKEGRYRKAIDLSRRAIQIRPKKFYLYNNLALMHLKLGEYEEAEKLLLKAISLNPKNSGAYLNIGVLYDKLGRTDQAKEVFQKAIENNKNFYEAYYNLGRLLHREGLIEEALKCFKRAEEIKPGYRDIRDYLKK
jgi:tetratricopeptide (TPR) repeat protein